VPLAGAASHASLPSRLTPRVPATYGYVSSLASVYNYQPMPAGLTEEEQSRLMGMQGQLWSEYFPNWKHVEYMAHPRSLALAERLWTPNESIQGFEDFKQRLQVRLHDLDDMGVNYRQLH